MDDINRLAVECGELEVLDLPPERVTIINELFDYGYVNPTSVELVRDGCG